MSLLLLFKDKHIVDAKKGVYSQYELELLRDYIREKRKDDEKQPSKKQVRKAKKIIKQTIIKKLSDKRQEADFNFIDNFNYSEAIRLLLLKEAENLKQYIKALDVLYKKNLIIALIDEVKAEIEQQIIDEYLLAINIH